MKKPFAIGATVLATLSTTVGSTLIATSGAQATPDPTCNTYSDYADAMNTLGSSYQNWVTSCVPQFGLGKAEFTITSDTDFPSDFKPLTDSSVTKTVTWTGSSEAAASTYLGSDAELLVSQQLQRVDDGSNARSQTYNITSPSAPWGVPFHIHSITRLDVNNLPTSECDNPTQPYTDAFKIEYDPVTLTYSQVASGRTWTATITAAPEDTIVAMDVDAVSTEFVAGSTMCITQNDITIKDAVGGSHDPDFAYMLFFQNPYPAGDTPRSYGTYNFTTASPSPSTHPSASPSSSALPNTGNESWRNDLWVGASVLLLAIGGALAQLSRRARRRRG